MYYYYTWRKILDNLRPAEPIIHLHSIAETPRFYLLMFCDNCDNTCNTNNDMNIHMKDTHGNPDNLLPTPPPQMLLVKKAETVNFWLLECKQHTLDPTNGGSILNWTLEG